LLHDGWALTVAALDALRVQEDRKRADEPDAAIRDERDVLVGGQRAVFDGAHAFLDGEAESGPAVGVSGGVSAGAVRLLDSGADRLARGAAAGGPRAGRAAAAGDEDLQVGRAAREVLAGGPPHLVHPVEASERPAVSVVGGQPARGDEKARAGHDAGLDGVAQVDIEE